MNEQGSHIKASLIRSYTAEADGRDSKAAPEWKDLERQRFLERMRLEGKQDMLEIGAGTGRDGLFFQKNGLSVTCIDITSGMTELCRAKGLRAHVMDVSEMTFNPGSFDAVFLMNSLVHIPKTELHAVLEGIARVLEPDGFCFNCMRGGIDFEGVYEADDHEPKRYFTFYGDERVKEVLGSVFILETFRTFEVGRSIRPQVMYLRKR